MVNLTTPLISLQRVSKCFHTKASEIEILNQASFDIHPKETIAVVGASGIGKSTLMHIIGTLDSPDTGSLFFKTDDLSSYSDRKLARFRNKKIGFVFQFHYLLQGFSALENVMIPGFIARENKKKVEKNAINMLERTGLADRKSHRVEDLSGGEQQRVALARALVNGPDILLADEPTGNLDQATSENVHQLLGELNEELGMSLIVVTHNPQLAGMLNRKVTIHQGKIVPV